MFLALEFLAMQLTLKGKLLSIDNYNSQSCFSVLIFHVAVVIFLLGCTAFTQSNATFPILVF